MNTLRRYRTSLGAFMIALVAIWQILSPMNLEAATYYWDSDADGTNGALGGTGTWNTSSLQWDPDAANNTDNDNALWSNLGINTAVFGGTAGTVTLGVPITAGGLTFNTTGYSLTGSTLTLDAPAGFDSPVIAVNKTSFGSNRAIIDSIIAGASGFTKTGNGSLVLTNNANSFSGDLSIKQGQLIVTSAAQLGTGTTAISVTGVAQTGNPGYSGGSLVLQGAATSTSGAGINLNREVSVSGRGPGAVNNTGGLVSIGYNTLAGGFTLGSGVSESRVWATHGITTISSDVFLGAGGSQIFQGNGNWIISGRVGGTDTGTDRLLKSGQIVSSTLWLQNTTNNFLSTVRIDSGTVRVGDNGALGLNTGTQAVDLLNGILEIRTDAPNFSTRKVRVRGDVTAGIFVDRAIGGSQINQTVSFSDSLLERNTTFNITGRNGYNVTFASLLGGNDNFNTLNNNSNGLLTITGNIWGTANTTARTYTLGGNGDSLIGGNIIASGAAHAFTKAGSGVLAIQGTGSTFTGITNLNAGTLMINGFGAINTAANAGRLNFAGGTLDYRGATGTGAGETVSTKTLLMNSTNSILLANQSGSSPSTLVIATNIGANTTAAKALVLGGTNTLNNEIKGVITNNTVGTSVTKIGGGTWQVSDPVAANYGTAQTGLAVTNNASQDFTGTSTTGLVVGQPVSGTNIPVGAVITEIMSATSFKINAATTGVVSSVNIAQVSGATAALAVTANTANLLTVASTAGLVVGQSISGTGMASGGWYISQINSATTFTVANSTGTAALANGAAIGSQTPTASVNYGGALTIGGGTFKVAPTTGGSNVINDGSGVVFNVDAITGNGWAGGTFEYAGFTTGSSETVGSLTPAAGAGTVKVTPGASGTTQLTFGSLATRSAGATLNFEPGTGVISFIASPALPNGIINGATLYNGTDWATVSAGNVVAYTGYTVTAGTIATGATQNIKIDNSSAGNITMAAGGNTDIFTLMANDAAARTVDVGTGNTLRIGTTLGGILVNSSSGGLTIGVAGATAGSLTTQSATSELVMYSNSLLTINSAIVNNTATSLTKSGTGTLVLAGTNTFTGGLIINQGTVQLSGTGTLGGTQTVVIRQDGELDLNGVSTGTSIGRLIGAGRITNKALNTPATLTIGNGITAATSSVFSGVIENPNGGTGALTNVTVTGAPTGVLVVNQALTGLNTYTGVTTISNTGTGSVVLQATSLANGGVNSSIGASSNAASNLVFNGGTLQYTGSTATIFQTTQTPSVSTDRLFTLAGNGTIESSGQYGNNVLGGGNANNASLIFSNTGDIAFLNSGTRTLTLGGTSSGDNELRIRLKDNPNGGGAALSLTKSGAGLWILNPLTSNTYTGETLINGGALQVASSASAVQGLSSSSLLTLSGGVLQTSGTFTRTLGAAAGNVRLTGGASGFAAATPDRLVVTLGGGDLTWGSANFAPTSLVLGSATALGETELTNNLDLGTAARTVTVTNNANTGTMVTAGILSGNIIGGAGGNFIKNGAGVLIVGSANTYTGLTNVRDGTLVVSSIGASGATATSVGTNVSGGALQLGNPTTTTTTNLMYVGTGETTTRAIQLIGTTGTRRIDSSGSGALVITSLAVTEAGAKTLELRGSNADNNMITSVMADNGILSITKNDGGVWILNPTGANTFSGAITSSGGLLGLTSNGIGNATSIVLNNGGIFAYGGALTTTATISGNNSTGVFAGQENITINRAGLTAVNKTAGNNQWTISNNLENGALLTINGDFVNSEAGTTTAATQTISIRGMGSTLWNGAITENAAIGGKIAWNIAIANDATFTMSGAANTYTGVTTLSQGTLILNKSLGATSGLTWNGGVIQAGVPLTLNTAITLANDPVAFSGTNNIDLTAATAIINSGGNRLLANNITGPAALTVTGNISLSNDNTGRILTVLGSGNTTVNGLVQNGGTSAGSLTYSGTGTLTLTGGNTATGALTVNRGTVVLSGANGAWNSTGNTFTINTDGILRLDNSVAENANRMLDGGAITIAGGTLDFIGDGNGTSESLGALTLGGVATSKITMSGAGPNVLTFVSVSMPNTGSSLNLGSIVGLGSTNKVIFTTSTGLNMSNNVISRVFVGGNDFATYDANGVGVFSAYNNSNNLNTAAATDTMNVTANATISGNKSINALKINGSGLTVGSANGSTLTLTAAGVLNTGGNNTLSQSVLAFGGTVGYFQVQSLTQLEVTSVMTGSNGFAKAGGGTLLLSTPSLITSTTNVLDGILRLNGGLNTLNANQILNIQLGGTLDLNGNTQYVGQLQAPGTMPNTGGTITTGVGTSTLVTNMSAGGTTFAGQITGNVNFGRVGGNTLTLESANTYTGQTVLMGGTTALENDATLSNTLSIDLNYATLSLNNNSSLQTQNNNRIYDAADITMRGGTLNYTGRVSTVASETFGALILAEGANSITATTTATTNITAIASVDLYFGALTRNAGTTVNFTGTNLGQQGNSSRIMFASAPAAIGSGLLGSWAIANSTDYAAYNAGNGVGVVGQGGYAGYTSQILSAANTAPLSGVFATGNITSLTSTANSSLLLGAGTTTTSLLRIAGGFTTDVNFTNNSDVLHLELGGILRSNNNNNTTIGTAATRGIITSGINELVVYNNQGTTTINSVIQGATQLIKSGGGTLTLTAANTYSLGTVVNQGTLNLSPTNPGDLVAGTGSLFTINGGVPGTGTTVNVNAAGALSAGTNLTLNGRSTINFANSTTNTINNLTINNNGGEGNPTVNVGTGSVLNITSSTITATSSNAFTTATISGGILALAAGTNTFNIDAIKVGTQNYISTQTTLNISSIITGAGVNFTKTGAGILQLSGANTFTGPVAVNAGTLRAGVASVANVSGAFGLNNAITLANTAGVALDISTFNTQIGSLAGGGALGGNVLLGSGATLTTGVTDASTTFAGGISGAGGLAKVGSGTMTLSGVHTYTGGTTVGGGVLKLDYSTNNSSKLSDTGVLTMSGGTLELAGGGHTETVLSTTLTAGTANSVIRSSGTGVLQMNTITVGAGASINFSADNIASTDNLNTGGILGGWATVGGVDFAMNATNTADGLIIAYNGYTNVNRLGPGNVIADGTANNVRIVEAGSTTNITLAVAGGITNINTLKVSETLAGPAVIDPGIGETLRLGVAGGILLTNSVNTNSLTIGTTSGDGSLTAGGNATNVAGTISFSNYNNTYDITVNSNITNNGTGVVGISKQGSGRVVLNGTNAFTGTITVNEGTLQMGASGALGTTNTLTVSANPGATASFDINGRNVTLASITLGGSNGTSVAQVVNTGASAAITLGGNVTYNAANNPLGASVTANLNLGNNVERTFAVNDSTSAATDLTVSGNVTGTGTSGILKDNAGTMVLAGTNTYTGLTTVRNGTLALKNGSAIADTATVHVIGNNGINATLRVDNSETIGALTGNGNVNIVSGQILTVASNVTTVFNGGFTGAGTFRKTGTGTIELGGTSTGVINTDIAQGTLLLRNPNALGAAGSQATLAAGTTLAFNNTGFIGLRTTSTNWLATAAPTLATAGAMVVTSAERTYTTNAREMGDNTGWIYTSIMQNSDPLNVGNATWTFGEHFDDTAYLKLNGTQILNNGTWNAFSSGTGTVNVGDNLIDLRISNGAGGVGAVNQAGVDWSVATPNLFGVGYSSLAAPGSIQDNYIGFGLGTDDYVGGVVASFKAYTEAHVAADLNLGGSVTINTTDMVDATDRVFLDGVIRNAPTFTGAVVKEGYRDLVLTGANTYSGTTTVNQGNLQVGNGGVGQTGTGAVIVNNIDTVAAFSVLSGTGTVQGATTVTLGTVKAGDAGGAGTGTLTFSNGLTYAAGSVTEIQISGALSNDRINVSGGTLTLNSATTIQVLANGFTPLANTSYSWNLFDWVGALSVNGFSAGTSGRTGNDVDANEGNLDLFDISSIIGSTWDTSQFLTTGVVSIVAVPEPSRMLLLMFGLMALFFRRRRVGSR